MKDKKSDYFKMQAKVVRPLIEYYRKDKIKLVKFLIKEGYTRQRIAEVLDLDPSAITHLLSRAKIKEKANEADN